MSPGSPGSSKPRHDRGFAFSGSRNASSQRARADVALLLGIGLGVLYAAAIVLSFGGGVRGDELYHYAQVDLFRRGDFRVLDVYLTTIPGYHAAVAALLALSGFDSLAAARTINALFGLAAIGAFHTLRRRLWPGTETLVTAQLIVLPILAPLFFLVYTDVLALALILWAAVATFARRHVLAALALSGVVLVRQNDVVWAAFLAVVATWPIWREQRFARWKELVAVATPYAIPLALFLAFWVWNGSISLSHGQAQLHPELTLHLGNPCFALLLAGLLLPLQTLAGLGRFMQNVRARPWLAVLPIALFACYWWGFRADNPYNTALPDFIPRNAFLLMLDHDAIPRALAGVAMVLAACGLAQTRLHPREAAWLYPFAAFFLASSWLVEQRYVLVPLVLWLAFREQRGRVVEYATLALWLVLAVFVFSGIIGGRFFL